MYQTKIIRFLKQTHIICHNQHGVQEKDETINSILSVLDFIYNSMTEKWVEMSWDVTNVFYSDKHSNFADNLESLHV